MEDQDLINFTWVRPAGLHTLKLSVFWVDKPDSWFLLAKSRFRLHGINRKQTKYEYLVSALTKEVAKVVLCSGCCRTSSRAPSVHSPKAESAGL
jgi:hypothetical protein